MFFFFFFNFKNLSHINLELTACPSISGSKISRKQVQLQGFRCGEQTQLLLGLCQGTGTQPFFSTCGNQLGGAWAFSLEEGRTGLGHLLVFAPGNETHTNLSDLGLRLLSPGCAHRDAGSHL